MKWKVLAPIKQWKNTLYIIYVNHVQWRKEEGNDRSINIFDFIFFMFKSLSYGYYYCFLLKFVPFIFP